MHHSILEGLRTSLLERGPLEQIPEEVWRFFRVANTWGTNAIEGNTLTLRDVERLLLRQESVGGHPLGDVLEVVQHDRALRGLFHRVPKALDLVTVLELHEEVFKAVKADAGQWRRVNVRITGSKLVLPRWEKVLSLMAEWARDYARREGAGDPVFEVAAWMHEQFEGVHPFSDGNGRVGRLLLNLHFLKRNWPPISVLPAHRDSYIQALESSHGPEKRALELLLESLMGASLVELLDAVGAKEDELKPLASLERRGEFDAKYLALRASQGALPAMKQAGEWRTSPRALRLYREHASRS